MAETPLDLALISAFTGGVNMPTREQATANYVPVAAVMPDGSVNLSYVDPAVITPGATAGFAASIAPLLRGTGLTVTSANKLQTRVRPRRPTIVDMFIGGTTTSGNIGRLGWYLHGSGATANKPTGGFSLSSGRKFEIVTGSSINNVAALGLSDLVNGNVALLSEINLIQFNASLETKTDVSVFFGISDNQNNAPGSDAMSMGLLFDSSVSTTNWLTGARDSSTGSYADSGVAAPAVGTSFLVTLQKVSATSWDIYVGGSKVGATLASNVPTGFVTMGMRVETLSAATKAARIGYFSLDTDLTGAMDDDAFLEV